MFISNADKQYLLDQVKALVKDMNLASSEITMLKGKVRALEGTVLIMKEESKQKKAKKPKKVLTPEQKAKQREYQRMYKARKKQEEQDWKLVQAIAGEGNTNVSA